MQQVIARLRVVAPAASILVALSASPSSAQNLPAARTLIDSYIEAVGGREAMLAHQSARVSGTFTMATMGMTGKFDIWTQRPNRMTSTIEISGIGQVRRGFDGEVGWSLSPIEGPRLIEGPELVQLRDEAAFLASVRDTSLIASAETVERTEMGGTPCYLVRLRWKSGRESFDCYAVDGGLLVGSRMTAVSSMGSIETTTTYSDYRQFGRYRMPAESRQQLMGTEQVIRIQSVEYDAVQDSVFALPPEIRALIGG